MIKKSTKKRNVAEENISQEFRLKEIHEKRNYLIEEINQNELISYNHRKVCESFVGIPLGNASSAAAIKICKITVGIKKYMSIIKKKTKRTW